MPYLELRCRLPKCWIDQSADMDLRKCVTQDNTGKSEKFEPCAYLSVKGDEDYTKGEVWKKFGEMIDKSKPNDKKKLL
jgi:hypothetical protein